MARIRTVKPEFFKHYDLFLAEKESGLPLRLGFQGLWLLADKQGAFRWQPQVLKLDILPYDNIDFNKVLEILLKEKFIGKYQATDGKHYGIIPSFQEHQRITGTEAVNPPLYPSPTTDYDIGNTEENLGNIKETLRQTGRERKGRELEGKGNGDSPDVSEGLIFNIEDYLKKNETQFENVCMGVFKTKIEVLPFLTNYHLWNVENGKYPKAPLQLIAGLQRWILNEKKYKNGNHKGNIGEKPIPTIQPTGGFGKL